MSASKSCIVCKKTKDEIPLTKFHHKESKFYICPQHLPVLIHHPQNLIGILDDADKLQGA